MRVTHVITRLIVGGAQENTVDSVLGLHGKPGLEIDLVSGPTSGPEGSLEHRVSAAGLLTIEPFLVRPLHPFQDLKALFRLTRRFRSSRPSIVHTHSGKAGIVGRLAARRARVPLILHTIHGPSFGRFQGPAANTLFTAAERLAGRCTTHFISVAAAMTDQYLAAGIGRPDQFTTVFSGFRLQSFLEATNDPELRRSLGIGPQDFVLGKIARLAELKGHDDLFDAMPELVRRLPRLRVLLIGDGPRREEFATRVAALGLGDRVIFAGLVPPPEIPRYVGIMDALVHLSYREGLPRALPQALAAGRPVVAYDTDGSREVCIDRKTGFLLPAGDAARLPEIVDTLATSPDLRERLGAAGRDLVRQQFTVERMVDDLYTLYRRLGAARGLCAAE